MQSVFPQKVQVEREGLSVDLEMTVADAVGAASRRRTEIGGSGQVRVKFREAQHQRWRMAINPQILQHCTIGQDPRHQPAAAQRQPANLGPVWKVVERLDHHHSSTDCPVRALFSAASPTMTDHRPSTTLTSGLP